MQILDPATGTGTFITSLINYLPEDRLEYKYRNEIHANEVAILPYYIANLNIEYTYQQRTGRYLEFPNLCFVDTLDNLDWQQQGATGGAVTRQGFFNLGGLSEENWIRIQEQNEKPISVIIGNPPYNANQQNENDNNKNREYPEIDKRISDTYIAASTAQKTKQYDMYKRFIRWASDRLADDGIIGFITNRAYLDTRQDDGFRKIASQEFTDIYILDLGSDVRRNPKISGTTHNVFGIQTGVAIGFFVREKARVGQGAIHYARREDAELAKDKLAYLKDTKLDSIGFEDITPDKRNDWLNQSNSDFERLLSLAGRETKLAKTIADERAVYGLYSMGVVTNRDEWVYDFTSDALGNKVRALINTYEETRAGHGGKVVDDFALGTYIKWTRDLKRQLRLDSPNVFQRANVRETIFRPFTKKALYFSQNLNEMQYQLPEVFPKGDQDENTIIAFCVNGKVFILWPPITCLIYASLVILNPSPCTATRRRGSRSATSPSGGCGSSESITATNPSPRGTFSPTPTGCSMTLSTERSTPSTCYGSSPGYPSTRSSRTGRRWGGSFWSCTSVSSRRSPIPWSGWSNRGRLSGLSLGPTRNGESSSWTT